MGRLPAILAIVVSLLVQLAPANAATASGNESITGLWINPHRSVAVQNQFCGNALCGHVVWASPDAKTDARDSGITNLVGTDLLQDYRPSGRGSWKGTVFVPDLGRHFSSEIDVLAADRIKISGCILHGLICKSQIWTRIGALPQ